MRGPKPEALMLSEQERKELEALVRRYSTPQQMAQRGRQKVANSNNRVFVCSALRSRRRFDAVDIDVAQPLHNSFRRKAALLSLEAIDRRMECSKDGIGGVGDVKSGQFTTCHCFNEELRQQFVQPPIPRRRLKRCGPGGGWFVARLISPLGSGHESSHCVLLFEEPDHCSQHALQLFKRRNSRGVRQQGCDCFSKPLIRFAEQIQTEFALIGIPAIQRPLSNPSSQGNLMHTDRLNALFGEETAGHLQNALAMLCGIASFGSPGFPYQFRGKRCPDTLVECFAHSTPS